MRQQPPESLEIHAHSTGKGAVGSRVALIVLASAVMTAALTALFISKTGNEALVPLTGCIPLVAFVWAVLQSRPKPVHLRVQPPMLTLQEGRNAWQASVIRATITPWIMPGVGVAQGAVLSLETRDTAGLVRVLHIAATGVAAPDGAQHDPSIAPEMWVSPPDLRSLIASLELQSETVAAKPATGHHRFSLVRRPSAWQALSQIVPWLGTMAVLGVAGVVFGDTIANSTTGQVVFGVCSAAFILFGIRRTMKKASAPKPTLTLVVTPHSFQLVDAGEQIVWTQPRPTQITPSNYLYRTKYSSHRFSVRQIGPTDNMIRIGVWDPSFTNTAHPDGPAPTYIVGAPDWSKILTVLN